MPEPTFQTGHGRVFFQAKGANPGNSMKYLGRARMGGFTLGLGDPTPIRDPSRVAYDQFEEVDEVAGEESRPTTSIIARFGLTNELLDELSCPGHIQVHYGKCADPQDQNGGWEMILDFSNTRFTNISSDDLTALESAERAPILLTADVSARIMAAIHQMALAEKADTEVTREVVRVLVSDYVSCGECGYESDGNQRLFVLTKATGLASPNISPALIVSYDGGLTWTAYDITSMDADDDPTSLIVAGGIVVVTSNDDMSVHVSNLADLTTWVETSATYDTGVNDVWAASASQFWMVGDGGYIWYSEKPASLVTEQEAGALTTENLTRIRGLNSQDLVAVGENGTILVTNNGGKTWFAAPTVPAAALNITSVWMRSKYTWIITESGGNAYYTRDAGQTWEEIDYPLKGLGTAYDVVFARTEDGPVGYLAATDADNYGHIFRTIDGGDTWYELPDTASVIPTNRGIKTLSCGRSYDFLLAGGVKGSGATPDGIVIIGN